MNKPTPTPLYAVFKDPTSFSYIVWANLVNFFIFVSCIGLVLETVEPLATNYSHFLRILEWVSVAFFTLDYLGNLIYSEKKVSYIFSFWGLVDLISILPTYLMALNLTAIQGTKVFRLLRVIRVLRVLKLARTALREARQSKAHMSNPIIANLKIYFIALFSVLMISSTLMFYVEGHLYSAETIAEKQAELDLQAQQARSSIASNQHGVSKGSIQAAPVAKQYVPTDPVSGDPIPEDKRFFTSIPTAMWWCITTLTTTGYGDMYPVTFFGRIIAGATMLLGLVLFGILMNIVGKTLMVMLFGEHIEESKSDASASHDKKLAAIKLLADAKIISPEDMSRILSKSDAEIANLLKK